MKWRLCRVLTGISMLHSLRKRRCEDGASPSGNGIEHMCPHHWEKTTASRTDRRATNQGGDFAVCGRGQLVTGRAYSFPMIFTLENNSSGDAMTKTPCNQSTDMLR